MDNAEDLDGETRHLQAMPNAFKHLAEIAADPGSSPWVREKAKAIIRDWASTLRHCATDPVFSGEDRAALARILMRYGR